MGAADKIRRVDLGGAVIVFDDNQPGYVRHAVSELRDYLREITMKDATVTSSLDEKADVIVAVGKDSAQGILGEPLQLDGLGDEGFLIKSARKDGRLNISVAGAGPQGTKFGVANLMNLIRRCGNSAWVPESLDVRTSPHFAVRGIHLNGWAFKYPYTFRCWPEADWRRYIDLQTLQGVNHLYIWPFMEIMPVPLSPEDESYLDEMKRLIEYARVQHGMEVWIMQAVNRVAKDDCGVRDPRHRPYWRPSQPDLDPGDSAQFKKIAESHKALYRILTNADGFCFIDCDPGGWPGSPPGDLLKVLLNARRCLDRYSVKGPATKLIHWLWGSWGHMFEEMATRERVMRDTLRLLKAELPEPWELICGIADYLPWCRDERVLDKTVFLPYETIEGEPSYPGTNLDMGRIRSALQVAASYPELKGVMANVQTPLLQFPKLYYWNMAAWDPSYLGRTDKEVLLDLAELIYPSHAELLAKGYRGFERQPSNEISETVQKIEAAISGERFSVGSFGRKLFPDILFVARSLLLQLRIRVEHQAFIEAPSRKAGKSECVAVIERYLDAYLRWDTEHGWHGLWGYDCRHWPLGRLSQDPLFDAALKYMHEVLSGSGLDSLLAGVADGLSSKYDRTRVQQSCISPLGEYIARGKRDAS